MERDPAPIQNEATEPVAVKVMSRSRVAMVLVLLLGMLGGHAYCVIANDEFWPFSNYPMYSLRHWDLWTNEYLVGTAEGDPSQEVPISYFEYDRPISVKSSMHHMSREMLDDASKAKKLGEAMLGLGQIYQDKHSGQGDGAGQGIGTLRLYRITWQIVDGETRKVAKEIKRELIMEVGLAQGRIIAQGEGL